MFTSTFRHQSPSKKLNEGLNRWEAAHEPGDGEKGGLVVRNEVSVVEEDLRDLYEEEREDGSPSEPGGERVPLLQPRGLLAPQSTKVR